MKSKSGKKIMSLNLFILMVKNNNSKVGTNKNGMERKKLRSD